MKFKFDYLNVFSIYFSLWVSTTCKKNILSIQWPAGFCQLNNKPDCYIPDYNIWTIHGLWPKKKPSSVVSQQILSIDALEKIKEDLHSYWPDVSSLCKESDETFWMHEWNAHGKYLNFQGSNHVLEYFERTLSLYQNVDVKKALDKYNIKPSNNMRYARDDVKQYLSQELEVDVVLKCGRKKIDGNEIDLLIEVRICLDNDLIKSIDCGNNTNCMEDIIYYSPDEYIKKHYEL